MKITFSKKCRCLVPGSPGGKFPGRAGFCWALAAVLVVLALGGCGRKPRTVPPSPPPTSTPGPSDSTGANRGSVLLAPELDLRIEPPAISPGESALLTWESRNADRVVIEPAIGEVESSGRIKFYPDATTTYSVTAEGPGGELHRKVTVEVRVDAPPVAGTVTDENLAALSPEERFEVEVKPVYFSFDSAELTDDSRLTLDGDIRWLNRPENRHIQFVLEGHADERGSDEYNLALGDKRAVVVRDYLVQNGVDAGRIQTVSLGEERPFDNRQTEEAYALNRRTEFVLLRNP